MPRKVNDLCMFCGEEPCPEHAPKKAAVKPRKKVASSSSSTSRNVVDYPSPSGFIEKNVPTIDVKSAMKAAAAVAPQPRSLPKVPESLTHKAIKQAAGEHEHDELDLHNAIRALATILHPTELDRYEHLLSPSDRAKAWKERRG